MRRHGHRLPVLLAWVAPVPFGCFLPGLEDRSMSRPAPSAETRGSAYDVSIGFVRARWRPLVVTGNGIDRRFCEICAPFELKQALRAGDIRVEGPHRLPGVQRRPAGRPAVFRCTQGPDRARTDDPMLTMTEAAEAVGMSRSTLYAKVKAGELSRTPEGTVDAAELLRAFGG